MNCLFRYLAVCFLLVPTVGMLGCGGATNTATIAPAKDLQNHLKQLESDQVPARSIAVSRLGEMGAEAAEALPKLEDMAANDPNSRVRIKAQEAVQKIKAAQQ
jgi:HEAT repeat protein